MEVTQQFGKARDKSRNLRSSQTLGELANPRILDRPPPYPQPEPRGDTEARASRRGVPVVSHRGVPVVSHRGVPLVSKSLPRPRDPTRSLALVDHI